MLTILNEQPLIISELACLHTFTGFTQPFQIKWALVHLYDKFHYIKVGS